MGLREEVDVRLELGQEERVVRRHFAGIDVPRAAEVVHCLLSSGV